MKNTPSCFTTCWKTISWWVYAEILDICGTFWPGNCHVMLPLFHIGIHYYSFGLTNWLFIWITFIGLPLLMYYAYNMLSFVDCTTMYKLRQHWLSETNGFGIYLLTTQVTSKTLVWFCQHRNLPIIVTRRNQNIIKSDQLLQLMQYIFSRGVLLRFLETQKLLSGLVNI